MFVHADLQGLKGGSRIALFVFALFAAFSFTSVNAAGSPTGYFNGEAYSTYGFTQAGPLNAQLGRLTYLPCPCTGTNGQVRSDSLPSMDAGTTLRTQALYASVSTNRTASAAVVKDTAQVIGLTALGGWVTADKLLAVANTTANATTITSSDSGSTFVNLRIGTAIISANTAPNTKVNLLGFGYAIVREVKPNGDGKNQGGVEVNMLHVFITTQNALNIPVGAEFILAHASSGFGRAPIQIQYSGVAYVTLVKGVTPAITAQLGRVAPSYVGCQGTGGQTNTNGIASLRVPKILSLANGATTAVGGMSNSTAAVTTTSTVQNVNLLNGMIQADAVTAKAKSTFTAGVGTSATNGSGFTNLRVNGKPVVTVQANTKIDLPGIGYVLLYEVKQSASAAGASTSVNMIHIFVSSSNGLGLPVGAELLVSTASASVKPF